MALLTMKNIITAKDKYRSTLDVSFFILATHLSFPGAPG